MFDVARYNWSTEQGGHGPIVLTTGIWLLVREYRDARQLRQDGNAWLGFAVLALLLPIYVIAGITGILEIQVLAMYAALIVAGYMLLGWPLMRLLWFPLFYLVFALPPPDSIVAVLTQPIKIAISEWAVTLLYALGYPVGSSGVMLQIAQYELLVAAACSGLNSLISLSAICLFYAYLRHRSDPVAFTIMALAVVPVAVFSNFVRVIILILVTYYLSESAAQGFLHDFAGIVVFAAALACMLALDGIYARFASRKRSKSDPA
jgi:exosortase